MHSELIEIRTGSEETVVDLTHRIERFLSDCGAGDGLLNVFVPHATAGIALIETGAGSDSDLLEQLREGGVMVLPVGQTDDVQQLLRVEKTAEGLHYSELSPVRFVPLLEGVAADVVD